MRSTRVSSLARLVMTAETCGMSAMPAKVAPPLKSTSTRLSCSDECVIDQAEHQRAEELRLAGAGRADHQAVRAHALLGGLLDVEVDQAAGVADADRHPQPVAGRARTPGGRGVVGVDVAEAEQLHVVGGRRGDVDGGARWRTIGADGLERREAAGEGLGGGDVALVDERLDRLLAHPHARRTGHLAELVGRPSANCRRRRVESSSSSHRRRQVEQGDAVQAVGRHDVVAGRQVAAVDDQQDVRRRRRARRRRSGAGR